MLLFCPRCANILYIEKTPTSQADSSGELRWACRTCPYVVPLSKVPNGAFEEYRFTPKQADDIIGGEKAWENVDKTEVRCANESCNSTEAFFRQVQTRSADEPMTSFFRCVKCHRQWQE